VFKRERLEYKSKGSAEKPTIHREMLTYLTNIVRTELAGTRETEPWANATEFRRVNSEYVSVAQVFGGSKMVCVTCKMSLASATKLDCMSGKIMVDGKTVPVVMETCIFNKRVSVSYYADPAVTGTSRCTHERVVKHLIAAMLA
jgi:hypothetical protein